MSRHTLKSSREPRATRDVILDVAERCFAEAGFAGVSVREIAADAGLKNQASLYNHFKNKRALYEATLARGLEPILALIAAGRDDAAVAANRPVSGIAFLDPLLDYLAEHPHLPRLIQRAVLDDARYLRNAATQLLRPLYTEGLQVLSSSGRPWQPAELPHLGIGLYHLIFGYFADARLLAAVIGDDPLSAGAVANQRSFLKAALTHLLNGRRSAPRTRRTKT